jgi:GNAT superfamily N-acetyltransferase
MELVKLGALGEADWAELVADELEPWGSVATALQWRAKDSHVGLRAADGRLLAVGGAVTVEVEVAGAGRFAVVGLGSVFVTRAARGRGLASRLLEPLLELATEMGPDRAMLFCRTELEPLYAGISFARIPSPVWADQPDRRVEMPMAAMWRALRGHTCWPSGRVDVIGLPF